MVDDFLRNLQSSGVVKSGTSPLIAGSTIKNGDVLIQFCSRQIMVGFGGILIHCDPGKLVVSPQAAIYYKHHILVYCQFSMGIPGS